MTLCWWDVDSLVLSLLMELRAPFGRFLTSTVRMGECVLGAGGPFLCSRPGELVVDSDLIFTSCFAFEDRVLEATGSSLPLDPAVGWFGFAVDFPGTFPRFILGSIT